MLLNSDQGIEVLTRDMFRLLEGTADATFAVDQQGVICSWNRAAEKLFGYQPSPKNGGRQHRKEQWRVTIESSSADLFSNVRGLFVIPKNGGGDHREEQW
jgi:PAS domain-containing protein